MGDCQEIPACSDTTRDLGQLPADAPASVELSSPVANSQGLRIAKMGRRADAGAESEWSVHGRHGSQAGRQLDVEARGLVLHAGEEIHVRSDHGQIDGAAAWRARASLEVGHAHAEAGRMTVEGSGSAIGLAAVVSI